MTLCLPLLLHSPHNCLSSILYSGPPVPSEVLALHIDNKARRSRRRCHRKPVLPSAPCVHKCTQLHIVLPTRFRASAHTIAPPMPRAPPPRHNVVPRQQSSPAQQHRMQPPILAQVLAPASIHTYYVLQFMLPTLSAPRSCPLCATAGARVSCFRDRLLYTRAPPCPRKSSCPQHIHPYHHPFAAATP